MGLLNFVKNAGKALFGKADASETNKEEAIKKEIEELGLDSTGLDISVDGDTVTIDGDAVSQEMKEKIILAAGNVDGIGGVEDKAGGGGKYHTVKKGDTLWAISEEALGNGSRYNEIFEANKPMLTHPDKIYPGQVLRIPE